SFNAVTLLLFIGVWAVGMIAMMLPSLLPMIYMGVSASRKSLRHQGTDAGPRTVVKTIQFVLGYFRTLALVRGAAFLGLTLPFRILCPIFWHGGRTGGTGRRGCGLPGGSLPVQSTETKGTKGVPFADELRHDAVEGGKGRWVPDGARLWILLHEMLLGLHGS